MSNASDHEAIVGKLNLYGFAVDTQRWDLFDDVFTDYVDADFGGSAHWTSLAQFKADFAAFHAPFDATQHSMSNHQVRVRGDRAHSFTYGAWRLIRHAAANAEADGPLWDGTGWYDDEWVCTHAGWRITKRICRVIWSSGNDRVKETIPGVVFEKVYDSLRDEARAGRLGFLKAIDARDGD
jgi:hypothetical protein